MRLETIHKLCCPFDKGELELTTITKDINNNILEGYLHCPACRRIYPIVKGIPIMSPDEYREFKMEKPLLDNWKSHLKGQKVEDFRLIATESSKQLSDSTDD